MESKINGEVGHEVIPLWINGRAETSSPSKQFSVRSASLQKTVHFAESANEAAAIRAADVAWNTFHTWKKTSGTTRRNIVLRYAALLRENEKLFVDAQQMETSATKEWAEKSLAMSATYVEEIASHITSIAGSIPQSESPDCLALSFREPIGPVLTISPWNSAVLLAARSIMTPVAAGCTVVFKASEICPKTHGLLVRLAEQAGLPPGVINVIQTSREDAPAVTEALIAHQAIRKIEFVGSDGVGRIIGQLAAKYLKPVLMELGGKGPAIVLDDADLEGAAASCITGALLHHGQLCFSTERIIVHQNVAAVFTELLKAEAKKFPQSCAVSAGIAKSSQAKLVDAHAKGAKFLIGGPSITGESQLTPTILTGITRDMDIYDQEGFGPSVSLYTVKDDAEAIRQANDSQYGLTAAIYSKNMERALDVAKQLDVPQVGVNTMTVYDEPTHPLQMGKATGWGMNNAKWGLDEFLINKTITMNFGKIGAVRL